MRLYGIEALWATQALANRKRIIRPKATHMMYVLVLQHSEGGSMINILRVLELLPS